MNKQKFVVLISVVSFFGSTAFGAYKTWQEIAKQPAPSAQATPVMAKPELIQRRISGYETVLSKDPKNVEARHGLQLSLEDLTNSYIAADNYQASIMPLERLLKEYPDRSDYKKALDESRRKIHSSNTP
jgi:predicted GTPase